MSTAMVCASHSPLLHCYSKEPESWEALQQAYKKTASVIREFDPELVIAFGSDHFNGFFLKMMPAFCVGAAAEAANDIGGYPGPLAVPQDIAFGAVEFLRSQDIDPAVSYQMTVDHAFSQTIVDMLGSLGKIPLVPVFINCITTPFVPFKRTRLMGEAMGRYAKTLDKRVLFLGSGGMSHHPTRYYPAFGDGDDNVQAWQLSGGDDPASLSPPQWLKRLEVMHHEGADMIARGERTAKDMRLNAESDQRFLDILTSGEFESYDDWDQYKLVEEAGIGSMELHAWIAAAAAHKEAGGANPQLGIYTVAPEIGIAAGIVYAS
jgi:2,3-dihydroxyphenylpropionate 1,2-dioxygenase